METDSLENLKKAVIYAVDEPVTGVNNKVECMFNPSEYTISKSNAYDPKKNTKSNEPSADFVTVGPMDLRLSLIFDTYETGEDVNTKTRGLWKFMNPIDSKKNKKSAKTEPVKVAFEWGVFKFIAIIKSITQKFTLFTHDGVPVRAKVDVNFTQYLDPKDDQKKGTNPTSGGGPTDSLWKVIAGDRLDNIAERVYFDASKWRLIAEHNHLSNPLSLKPGMILRIPED